MKKLIHNQRSASFVMPFSLLFFVLLSFGNLAAQSGQYKSKYPDIPIVDVHVHIRAGADVANYLKVSEVIKRQFGSNLA